MTRNMLHIVAGLSDADMVWLLSMGKLRMLRPEDNLVEPGRAVSELFFVLRGTLAVLLPDGTRVAALAEGEVIGEMSFVDQRPPSVAVRAVEHAEVLAIPRQVILDRLEQEPVFAARFYRALAVFLAERLRETTTPGRIAPDDKDAHETAHQTGLRFRRLVGMLTGKGG